MEDKIEIAQSLLENGSYEKVIEILKDVDLLEAYLIRSEAYSKMGKKDLALQELDFGLQKFPFSYAILATKAEILEEMGKLEEALESIESALEFTPFSSEYRFVKARILYRLNRFEEANLELAEVLRTNPKNVDARIMRAFAYYNMGLKLDALSEINRALAFDKENPKLHSLKGKIYYETGFHKLALSEFKIASHYDPENPEHYYNAAMCYFTLKLFDDALIYVDFALSKAEAPNYHALKASILHEMGRDETQEIKRALELDRSLKPVLENMLNVKIYPDGNIEKMK